MAFVNGFSFEISFILVPARLWDQMKTHFKETVQLKMWPVIFIIIYLDSKASMCANSRLLLDLNCCIRKLGVCFAAFVERTGKGTFSTSPESNRAFAWCSASFQLPHQTANVFRCKMRKIWILWFVGSKRIFMMKTNPESELRRSNAIGEDLGTLLRV